MFLPDLFSIIGVSTNDKSSFAGENGNFFAFGNGSEELKPFINHKHAIDKKNPLGELKNLLLSYDKEVNPNILLGFHEGNFFYASSIGNIYLLLRRKGKIHPLLSPSEKIISLSGKILPEDDFIICTAKTFKDFENLDQTKPVREIGESLSLKIKGSENQDELGALFLHFAEKAEKEENHEKPKITLNLRPLIKIKNFLLSFLGKISAKAIKVALMIGILVAVIIISLSVINNLTKKAQARLAEETKKIETFQNNFKNASDLLNLNNIRSKEIAKETLNEIKKINLDSLNSKSNRKKLEELIISLEKLVKDSSGVVQTKAKIVYSTTILKKDSRADEIIIDGQEIYALDKKNSLVFLINLQDKSTETFNLSKLTSSTKFITKNADFVFVFGKNEIVEIKVSDKKIQTALKNDSSWKNIVDMATYAGNIYLLDSENNQVWKNLSNDTGFDQTKPYFESSKPESVTSFAIDSAIYILENNNLKKYLSGSQENFELDKIPNKSFTKPTMVRTSTDLNNIYILEPSQKRIVIFDKKSKYLSQVVDNKIEFVKTFSVNEKEKEIFFPIGADIYKISF